MQYFLQVYPIILFVFNVYCTYRLFRKIQQGHGSGPIEESDVSLLLIWFIGVVVYIFLATGHLIYKIILLFCN